MLIALALSRIIAPSVKREAPEEPSPPQAARGKSVLVTSPTRRRVGLSGWVAVVSLVIALITAIFSAYQVQSAQEQVAIAEAQAVVAQNTYARSLQVDDLRFVGKLSVALIGQSIVVENDSDLPIVNSAIWTLGETRSEPNGSSVIDTIRARIVGIGACKTLTVPLASFYAAAASEFPRPVASEVYLTVQASSGSWYTVSDSLTVEKVEGTPKNAIEAAAQTDSYSVLGDTLFEGDISDERIAELPTTIGPPAPITQVTDGSATIRPNSCAGGS